jgi:hypothetical protein
MNEWKPDMDDGKTGAVVRIGENHRETSPGSAKRSDRHAQQL